MFFLDFLKSNMHFCVFQHLQDFCLQVFKHYPLESLAATVVTVLVPTLYLLYWWNLRRWTFNLKAWGSYEIEKGVRCNLLIKDGKLIESLPDKRTTFKDGVKTAYDIFFHGLAVSRDGPCLGHLVDNNSRYEWLSYSEVLTQAEQISRFLRTRGCVRNSTVGLYAANSVEWIIAELACVFQSMITVPLYDTLGPDSVHHSINETEMGVIFCDSEDKLKKFLAERKRFPFLKVFILLRDKAKDLQQLSEQCQREGIELVTWSQAKEIGAQHPEIKDDPPRADDIFVIQYTSGTTGISKGVILTHRNMVSCIAGAENMPLFITNKTAQPTNPSDRMFLYLPLAHSYGQSTTLWFMYFGGSTGLSSGNVLKLIHESSLCEPTYFPLVPRIMNRFYTKIVDETKSGFKGWLFWQCYARKRALFLEGVWTRDTIYDILVFRKLQKLIGGRVRFMTCGSAPIAPEVLEFWRVVFGALVIEGYGQTESTAVTTCTLDVKGGSIGHPNMCCLVRLVDVPELQYTINHDPPQGEIALKGPNITPGYYKRDQLTKEAFLSDGWLLTGDIGEFLPDGSVRMIDRKKHIFKLSQGEYVAPEKIEAVYSEDPFVAQVFVEGNSLQPYLIAVVVPSEKEAFDWATEHNLSGITIQDLCSNKQFQRHVLNSIVAIGKEKRLNSIEQVKSIYLHPEAFSIENDLLTPSFKNRRAELRKYFKAQVEALYNEGPMITSSANK